MAALDHLFVTSVGLIDVPPSITGTYDALMPGSSLRVIGGESVWMCDPHEVLRRLPSQPRAKDAERAAEYERLRAVLDHARR